MIIIENLPYVLDTRVKAEASSLREAGWRVHVVCPALSGERRKDGRSRLYQDSDVGGVLVHSYRMKLAALGFLGHVQEYLFSLFHIACLSWRTFRRERFSIVHLCNPPDVLFVMGSFYKLMGVKVIFDHHDLFPEMILSRSKGLMRWPLYYFARLQELLTFRTSDAVLSTNQSYAEIAMRRGRVAEGDVFIVRNGPKHDDIAPVPPDPALRKRFPFVGCYAGFMGPDDGILELMETIRHIVQDLGRTDILFYFLGEGAARQAAADRALSWGIHRYVDMPGLILDRNLFRRYLSSADVMLAPEVSNPHNDKSTFIKIAEYMAVGKPIVAYDLRETRFTAGEAAVYVPSGDSEAYAAAFVKLLDDPARRALMGRIGIERVKTQFQWEHQRVHLLRAYDHVLSDVPKTG